MATKSMKVVKQKTIIGDRVVLPELSPRDPDTKYTGSEPLFNTQPQESERSGALMRAFNWYSRFFDRKMAKEQLIAYAEYTDRPQIARQLKRVDDREIHCSIAWMARVTMRGLIPSEKEIATIEAEIVRLIDIVKSTAAPIVEESQEVKSNRPNVQEIMRERAREAAGDLEGSLDDYIQNGARGDSDVNPVGVLSSHNILPQHVSMLVDIWKKKRDEFQLVIDGTDAQLNEAYSHYGKIQLRSLVKFCDGVLAGLSGYINVKKIKRAPRKRKAVSVEKLVAKIKYLKTFEEFKLTSVHPSKIIGAAEVWAYDTAKRKLHYYVADSHVGTLGVKGATILGFDTANSGVKTLRKPAEQLKKIMSAGKPASRKLFKEIAAVQAQPNGRTNENLIFLKVY